MAHCDCEHCGNPFDAADSLAGGLTNCPACGKATPVPGLNDPWFRVVCVGMAIGWALLTALGWSIGGGMGALILGGGSAIVIGLIYSSM